MIGMYAGKPDQFPAQCRARVTRGLTVPHLQPGEACQGTAADLVSDHCGAFTRMEPDGPGACALRDVLVQAPSQVAAGQSYTMTAEPAGGRAGAPLPWPAQG